MRPVHLHFEADGTRWTGRGWSGAPSATRWQRWLLAGALSAATTVCLVLAVRLWSQHAEWTQITRALQVASQGNTVRRAAHTRVRPALPMSEHAAWARLVGALNTPWNSVFDSLEQGVPADVALISIKPDASKATWRMEAEAATLDALLKGARVLSETPGIAQVTLVKHETQEQHPNRPVRLVMDVQLKRDAP